MGKNMLPRVIGVLVAVILMGFSISWLNPCGFGTDSYTAMNMAISQKLGISFGNWQAGLNILLFLVVLACGRHYIGLGTFANMLLVGYSCDFFSWIWDQVLPATFFNTFSVRVLVAIPALALFVLAAAVYMDMDLGTSPYDALSFILHKVIGERVPFSVLRILYDLFVTVLGYFFGAPFAGVTLAMAFLLGPAVSAVGRWLENMTRRIPAKN